jgi:hypothetical protein
MVFLMVEISYCCLVNDNKGIGGVIMSMSFQSINRLVPRDLDSAILQ